MIEKVKEEIEMSLRSNYNARKNYLDGLFSGEREKDVNWEGYLEGKISALSGILYFIEHEIITK